MKPSVRVEMRASFARAERRVGFFEFVDVESRGRVKLSAHFIEIARARARARV